MAEEKGSEHGLDTGQASSQGAGTLGRSVASAPAGSKASVEDHSRDPSDQNPSSIDGGQVRTHSSPLKIDDPANTKPPGAVNNLEDNGIPERLVYIAVIAGLLLTAAGGFIAVQAENYTPGVHFAALVACAGLAMVLVAVGGKSVGTWKTWSVAGAAAAAPLLFYLQWQLQPNVPVPSPSVSQVLNGELRGTGKFRQVTIWTSNGPLYLRRQNVGHHFQFVGLRDQIERAQDFFVAIENEPGKDPESFTINCIDSKVLQEGLKTNQPLVLFVRHASGSSNESGWYVYDGANKKYGMYNRDDCGDQGQPDDLKPALLHSPLKRLMLAHTGISDSLLNLSRFTIALTTRAHAQPVDAPPSLADLWQALEADSSDQRVAARLELSKRTDAEQITAMAQAWNIIKSSYRQDIGIVDVWNRAIKTKGDAVAVRIAHALGPSQVSYVLALTGYPDETMRANATRLVSSLIQATTSTGQITVDHSQVIMETVLRALRSPLDLLSGIRRDIQFQPLNVVTNSIVAMVWAGCEAAMMDRQQVLEVLTQLANGELPPPKEQQGRALNLARQVHQRVKNC